MHETYSTNEAKFGATYPGRVFAASLPFNMTTMHWWNKSLNVFLGRGGLGGDILCNDISDAKMILTVSKLDEGDPVFVKGIIDDSTLGSIVLKDCVITGGMGKEKN